MKRRDIVLSTAVVVILGGLIYSFSKPDDNMMVIEPQTLSLEDKIEESFNLQIPDDVERVELSDVSGGDSMAIATRDYKDGKFSHTVLADLPDSENGFFYEGWLVRGSDNNTISTGVMRVAKGGYLLDFTSGVDYTDHNLVVITLERTKDKLPETHILEGSFN